MANFIIVMIAQLWILSLDNWDILDMYTTRKHDMILLPIMLLLHLMWGVYHLVKYINYNRVDKPLEEEKGDIDYE